MSKSKAPRVKSPEEVAQETEFWRRRNSYHARIEVRQISSDRSIDIYLRHHQLGDIGSMHRQFKRGKEVSCSYVLPKVKGHRYGDTFVSITPGEVEE